MGGGSVLFAASLMLFAAAAPAVAECRLDRYAELPVVMAGPRALVTAEVNGVPARFIADSGAFFSTVSASAAVRLKLRSAPSRRPVQLRGAVGAFAARIGAAETFDIDRLKLRNIEFLIADSYFGAADGLLGQNLLGVQETEYDLAGGAIRLFMSKGCDKSPLAYWASGQAVSVLDIEPTSPRSPHVVTQARLNGRQIRVVFDTGAPRSVLDLNAALMAGAQRADAEAQAPSFDVGLRAARRWIMPFRSFSLGSEQVENVRIPVADFGLPGADMLLGADFFLSHRVLISRDQHKIYFTPNGAPMFLLDETAAAAPAAGPAAP